MKKKNPPLCLFFCLVNFFILSNPSAAQEVSWSLPYDMDKGYLPWGVAAASDSGFVYALASRKRDVCKLQRFDNQLTIQKERALTLPPDAATDGVFSFGKKICVLYRQMRRTPDMEQAMASVKDPDYGLPFDSIRLVLQTFSPATLEPDGPPLYLLPYFPCGDTIWKVSWNMSPDSNRLVCALLPDYAHYQYPGGIWMPAAPGDSLAVAVLNDSLQTIYADLLMVPTPLQGQPVYIRDIAVDEHGVTILAADVYTREMDTNYGIPFRHPTIFFYPPNKVGKVQFYELPFEDYFIHNFHVVTDKGNNLYVTGMYSGKSYSHSRGVFFLKIDPTRKKILQKALTPYPDGLAKKLGGKKIAQSGLELENFDLYTIQLQPDRGLIVAGEKQAYYNGIYSYEDLFVMRLKPDGSHRWSSGYKRGLTEAGASVMLLSYSLTYGAQGGFNLMMNRSTRMDAPTVLHQFTQDGVETVKELWNHNDLEAFFCPLMTAVLPGKGLIVTAVRRSFGTYKLGIVKLQ